MPIHQIQGPDGRIHEIDAPEGATEQQVMDYVKEQTQPGLVRSTLGGIAKGLTFGFSDEIGAGLHAAGQGISNLVHQPTLSDQIVPRPTMGETYDKELARQRALEAADVEAHPIATTAGQIAGAVGGGLLAAPAAGPVAAATGVGRLAAPVIGAANRLLPGMVTRTAGRVLPIAGGGAAAGGVAGFGEGEGGFAERAGSAAEGAAVGAAVGPVVAGATAAGSTAVGRVAHALNLRNPQTAADRQIVRSLDRSGVSVDEAATRLEAAGNDPTALVDVGGRNTLNLGATAANTPGTAMEAADRFVQGRRLDRPERLTAAGDTAFGGGSGTDVAEATASRQAQRSTEAAPLYERAFDQPAGMTEQLAGLLEDPIARQGMRHGLEIQRIENATRRARGEEVQRTADPAIHYDDEGVPRIVGQPTMRTIDAAKRGMDSMIESARDPVTGRVQWTERLRAIDGMRRRLVELADQGNPDYAAARAAWAGPSAQMEATQAGRGAFRADRDVVAARMTGGAPDVQEAYRLGAGRAFGDLVSDPGTAVGKGRKLLEDSQMQARLNSLLPPDRLEALNTALRRENEYANVERTVSPRAGSQTARLTAGGEDMASDVAGPIAGAVRQAAGGRWLGAAGSLAGDVLVRRLGQGINPATADALANRLFQTDPAGRQRVTEALRNRLLRDAEVRARAQAVLRPTIRGLGQVAGGYAGSP